MYEVFVEGLRIVSEAEEAVYREFWECVFSSYDTSLMMINRQPQAEGERAQVRKFLAQKRWADLTFVHPDVKRDNPIFQQLIDSVRNALHDCRKPEYREDAELAMALWLMKPSTKQHFYDKCENPEKHVKLFVLLPPANKEWVLLQKCDGKMHDKILFLAVHFPTVFPMDTPDADEALKKRNKIIRKHFMFETTLAKKELGKLVFFFPPTAMKMEKVEEKMGAYLDGKWDSIKELHGQLEQGVFESGKKIDSKEVLPKEGQLV